MQEANKIKNKIPEWGELGRKYSPAHVLFDGLVWGIPGTYDDKAKIYLCLKWKETWTKSLEKVCQNNQLDKISPLFDLKGWETK